MTDRMRLIPFDRLIRWIFAELERDATVFGIPHEKFFKAAHEPVWQLFGDNLECPFGPAAGPHTQLAQNIIAAYLTGSRFFELKTIQRLDGEELSVDKPCILAKHEGYNVEWSTELTVPDAFKEYVKAWFALHVLAKEFSLGKSSGFIFNMSVGYDLEGIQSTKVDSFIEGLKDASHTPIYQECRDFLKENLQLFKNVDRAFVEGISPHICKSITLSTLHGCPSETIEAIAQYFLEEKRLHTLVKLNPTLLGYDCVRATLDQMGYTDVSFDDHHFINDLQFTAAVSMIVRLIEFATERNLTFGVKLSNTLPVRICNNELPGTEMYMSGRALYPLTINLAYRLAKAFQGKIKISYSGGADFFNIDRIYATGIWPITLTTTLLKPGGYLRNKQMAELLERHGQSPAFNGVHAAALDMEALRKLAEDAVDEPHYQREGRGNPERKLDKGLPLTDCLIAPCTASCPIGQDVPDYIRLVGQGRYLEAFELIVAKNPLPFITGTLCNHRCTASCTRNGYDEAVMIREMKRLATEEAFEEFIERTETPTIDESVKIAVIGAGPAGLSAGYFLGKLGIAVTVFDRKSEIGGIVQHIAPNFRIVQAAVEKDLALVKKMGVKFHLNADESFDLAELKQAGFKYIFIATGAWRSKTLPLEYCDGRIIHALQFLETFKKSPDTLDLGSRVAVIGAGNSAMDAARSAKRAAGVEAVYILYRRTQRYMPADREELVAALAEGVQFKELLAPVSYKDGILRCQQMELGAPDPSGRRSPVAVIDKFIDLQVDTVIAAVGEEVETAILVKNGLKLDAKGFIEADPETGETNIPDVFIGGDALRGPATIVEAIADATRFAKTVTVREKRGLLNLEKSDRFNSVQQQNEITRKRGVLLHPSSLGHEQDRCLECHVICNLCTEVCPNRANIAVRVQSDNGRWRYQIIHIDGICNECGNCATFCPYEGAPYQDKLTLYWSQNDFEESKNAGFYLVDEVARLFKVRLGDTIYDLEFDEEGNCNRTIPDELSTLIWTTFKNYRYLFINYKD